MLSYGELGCQIPIFLYNSRREAFMEISLHKTEKGLKELHRRLAEEQKLRELPGLVARRSRTPCASRIRHHRSGWRLSRTRCASWMPPSTSKEDFKMDKIWANRLIAGTKTWAEMPARRHAGVKAELAKRVAEGEITAERYKEITGEDYDE